MSEFSSDVLSVIGEAVAVARNGKIVFSNIPAAAILGGDAVGKKLSSVFGAEFSGAQADDFTANLSINGKNCIARSTRRNGEQILVFREVNYDSAMINDAFLYSMRSNLMVMNMTADHIRRMAEESGSEEMLATADTMSRNLASASRLITNVSDVCGIQAQTLRFVPKTTDISRLFSEYTDIAASLLPEIDLSFEAPAGLEATVDNDLMKHLLSNLISNSVLHGKCRKLSIRLINAADNVILAVNDDGCGIRSEELYNVFERYRGTFALSDISRGAGLGLSAVMGIARLHGGTVLLESREGHGTAVWVSLRKNTVGTTMYSPGSPAEDVRDILTGLADCVEEKRFREAYGE